MSTTQNVIEIPSSKNKLTMLIFFGIILSFLSLWMLIYPIHFESIVFKNPNLIRFVGILGSIFFSTSLVLLMKKNKRASKGLVISGLWFIDHSNGASLGREVYWSDVCGVREVSVMSEKFIAVDIIDHDKYVKLARNNTHQYLLKSNIKMFDTPICISSTTLKISFKELKETITRCYSDYKSK